MMIIPMEREWTIKGLRDKHWVKTLELNNKKGLREKLKELVEVALDK